jgi:hypothetical protein
MKIVALYSPYPQMGKNTFADHLATICAPTATVSFAQWGRETVVDLASDFLPGGSSEAWEWLSDKRKDTKIIPGLGVTFRHLLQTILTDWGRKKINQHVWVMKAKASLRRHHDYRAVIFDDLRFPNEYFMLRKQGAAIIRIERKDAPRTADHESNALLEDQEFDYRISNDGEVEELQAKALIVAQAEGITGT